MIEIPQLAPKKDHNKTRYFEGVGALFALNPSQWVTHEGSCVS